MFLSLLLSLVLPSPTIACAGHALAARASNGSSANGQFTVGNDGPAPVATLGYTLNHFGLLVNDLDAMMSFYGEVLGMRHVFTYSTTFFDIVYMGYSHGGKNGTGFETGEELFREKTNTEGLLEFMYPKNCNDNSTSENDFKPSTKVPNTFSHVGLVVPDVMETQARMKAHGAKILKEVGVNPVPGDPIVKAFGLAEERVKAQLEALEAINAIGFETFLLVADPDGNLVEIQQQM
jgi:lactoylglutathione lyase